MRMSGQRQLLAVGLGLGLALVVLAIVVSVGSGLLEIRQLPAQPAALEWPAAWLGPLVALVLAVLSHLWQRPRSQR